MKGHTGYVCGFFHRTNLSVAGAVIDLTEFHSQFLSYFRLNEKRVTLLLCEKNPQTYPGE